MFLIDNLFKLINGNFIVIEVVQYLCDFGVFLISVR